MGVLPNGFEYTGTATGNIELSANSNNTYFNLVYTEYYNIYTNKSVLTVQPQIKGNNPVASRGTLQYTLPFTNVSGKSGILINGANLVNASGADIYPQYASTNYLRVSLNASTYHNVTSHRDELNFPWYSGEIEHNADGSKSVSAQVKWRIGYRYRFEAGDGYDTATENHTYTSVVGTIVLTNIPRASTLYVPDTTVGTSKVATLNAANPDFTHTITATYSDGYTQSINTSTLIWNPNSAHAYASMASSATSTTVTFTTKTYSGSTLMGTTTTTAKVYSAGVAPTVTLTGTINNPQTALTGTEKIIHNYTNITLTASAQGANGATIKSYSIDGVSGSTKTITVGAQHSFTAKALDSRGVEGTKTLSYSYVNYIKPTVSVTATLPDTTTGITTATVKGNWFNGSFGAASNTLTIQCRYYDIEDNQYGSWTSATVTKSGNTYTATVNLTVNYQKAYYIYARAVDSLNTIETQIGFYINNKPVFYWKKNSVNFNVQANCDGGLSIRGNTADSNQLLIRFNDSLNNNYMGAGIYYYPDRKYMRLTQRSHNTGGGYTSYYEYYSLPSATDNLTASKSYDLLTSKTYHKGTTAPSAVSTAGWQTGDIYIYMG